MKYRDKETGEEVHVTRVTLPAYRVSTKTKDGWPEFLTPHEFRARFGPVEDDD